MEPFLRWAGGKRWLAPKLAPLIEDVLRRQGGDYAEPFAGSAAVFFHLAPKRAILSDLNADLIEAYWQIRIDYRPIEERLASWPVEADFYNRLRSANPSCTVERAARFIYLNRTCYGGLHRENRQGQFNTPFGGGSRTPAPVLAKRLLEKAHFVLQNVTLKVCDFEDVLSFAAENDVVFCDPTYSNVNKGSFDRYGRTIFAWEEQLRLAEAANAAMERGALVIVSNGCFRDTIPLYRSAYRIRLHKKKTIGHRAKQNECHHEYLFVLDPLRRRQLWAQVGPIENRRVATRGVVGTAGEHRQRVLALGGRA